MANYHRRKEVFATFTVIQHQFGKVVLLGRRISIPLNCRDFIAWVDKNSVKNVTRAYSINAREYLGMADGLQKKDFMHNTGTPSCPQSSGVAERMNQTLMEKVRWMLEEACVIWKVWGDPFKHAANLCNCIISSTLDGITSHEALLGPATDNSNF